MLSDLFPSGYTPSYSGHETFVLRGTWLKKAYDMLCDDPDLFSRDTAFVHMGVGKNMASAIRHWGRVTGVFARGETKEGLRPTALGHALLSDAGWDPFLVTPASAWLLHYAIAGRLEGAFSWVYTFNGFRGGEFMLAGLGEQIQQLARARSWRVPSTTTIVRDLDCLVRCYRRPEASELRAGSEDVLMGPLLRLGLIQQLPGQPVYRLVSGEQESLPDALIAYAIHAMVVRSGRRTIAFGDLAYGAFGPGRIFRLLEDALLARLWRLEEITEGSAYYTDQAGIRQIAWEGEVGEETAAVLLARAFETEVLRG